MTPERPLARHVVLIGLPGAGKSTVGRAVARRLEVPFIDFDRLIEARTGGTIAAFFAEHGEPAFRALEVEVTRELAGASPAVLAPGGGWVTSPGVMELLRPPALIVHLRIRPRAAVARLRRSRVVRPLLQTPDPLATMRRLWAERRGLYARADAELNVEVIEQQELVGKIVALARGRPSEVG